MAYTSNFTGILELWEDDASLNTDELTELATQFVTEFNDSSIPQSEFCFTYFSEWMIDDCHKLRDQAQRNAATDPDEIKNLTKAIAQQNQELENNNKRLDKLTKQQSALE